MGAVVSASSTLAELPAPEVLALLESRGVVHSRGFGASDSEFTAFSQRFCKSFLGPVHAAANREVASDAGRTMTVNLGRTFVGLYTQERSHGVR